MIDEKMAVDACTTDTMIAKKDNVNDEEESSHCNSKDPLLELVHSSDWWENLPMTPSTNSKEEGGSVGFLPAMEILPPISISNTVICAESSIATSPIRSKKMLTKTNYTQAQIPLDTKESFSEFLPVMKIHPTHRNCDALHGISPVTTKTRENKSSFLHDNYNHCFPPQCCSSVTSNQWIDTLGDHVDIPFSTGIFDGNTGNEAMKNTGDRDPSKVTCNDDVPLLISIPSEVQNRNEQPQPEASISSTTSVTFRGSAWTPALTRTEVSHVLAKSKKSSRKKKPTIRKSTRKVPLSAHSLCEPTKQDVLNGGGYLHHGNQLFLNEIKRWQAPYFETDDKAERARIIEHVVDYVHNTQKGRFLEKEAKTGRWIPSKKERIRHKVARSIRESNGRRQRKKKEPAILPSGPTESSDTARPTPAVKNAHQLVDQTGPDGVGTV